MSCAFSAIATAITNGHLTIGGPDNPPVIVNPTPIRPMHPRAQYPPQYSSTPRVNAGDISQPSSGQYSNQAFLTLSPELRNFPSFFLSCFFSLHLFISYHVVCIFRASVPSDFSLLLYPMYSFFHVQFYDFFWELWVRLSAFVSVDLPSF